MAFISSREEKKDRFFASLDEKSARFMPEIGISSIINYIGDPIFDDLPKYHAISCCILEEEMHVYKCEVMSNNN